MKKGGVVQSVKSSRHIESSKNCDLSESMASMISLVNLSKAVSVEWNFRYADWRGEKLGEMERWGRRRANQAFQYFANSIQIGNRPEIWRIRFGEPGLLQKGCNEGMFEFWWESGLVKRQVGKVRYENRECAGAWLKQRCWNIIKWRRFVRHRVEQFCDFSWSDRCEVIEFLPNVGFIESKRRWRATEFGGYGEFKRDNFLTEESSQRVGQWFGNCWWKLFCRGGWVKDGFNSCPEWFGILGTAVDALKIGCCTRLHDQFISCAACSSVCEAVWFGVRSFPEPLKPAPAFLSFNSFRREPVLCLFGPRAVTSFEGSKIVQNRCYCIFHLLFKTIYVSSVSSETSAITT